MIKAADQFLEDEQHFVRSEDGRSWFDSTLFGEVLDCVDQGVAVWSDSGHLVSCNQSYRAHLIDGLVPELGMHFADLTAQEADRGLTFIDDRGEVIDAGQRIARFGGEAVTIEGRHPNGRVIVIQEQRSPAGLTVMTSTDVTRLRQQQATLEERFQQLQVAREESERHAGHLEEIGELLRQEKERAEAASRTKTRFLANMSHELRTPLNAIIGFSEIMRAEAFGELGSPKYREYADDIHASGAHLLDLINDILDMSKIEAGKYELQWSRVQPAKILETAARMVRWRAEEAGIELVIPENGDWPAIDMDARAIKQVLLNLLSNSIKYTNRGGRVSVDVVMTSTEFSIVVQDTGIGIEKSELAKVMRPFERSGHNIFNSSEGTGLGLALSNALVQLHGGSLVLESDVGVGTRVTVKLPIS